MKFSDSDRNIKKVYIRKTYFNFKDNNIVINRE